MQRLQNYIGGKLHSPCSGHYIDNYNPAEGTVYSILPDSDKRDVEQAISVAKKAFHSWSQLTIQERSQWLHRIADGIQDRQEELAKAESIDTGKALSFARTVDIPRAINNFRFFASAIVNSASESYAMPTVINYTLRKPIGVVGCISPWNLPLYLFSWKIAPALATGNCVLAKPSELSPVTASLLAQICIEVSLPDGVLNIIHGHGHRAGAAIVASPDIPAISFTGGTKTGKNIAQTAAPMFKKLSLELGGKNAIIIFADCDYDNMLTSSIRSSFANQGQICLSGSRIFVERSLYDSFKGDFIARVKTLTVDDPFSESTDQGALISQTHMNKVLSYIELAQNEGGKILCGGKRVRLSGRCEHGWFIEPTVIDGLAPIARCNQEEIFGPVVTLMPFDTEDDALNYANSTPYGLAAVLWTENLSRAHRLADALEAGIIWVNCWLLRDLRTPFGGMKQSGLGREGGLEALHFYTESKNICIKYQQS